jgi:hypothetical protein
LSASRIAIELAAVPLEVRANVPNFVEEAEPDVPSEPEIVIVVTAAPPLTSAATVFVVPANAALKVAVTVLEAPSATTVAASCKFVKDAPAVEVLDTTDVMPVAERAFTTLAAVPADVT